MYYSSGKIYKPWLEKENILSFIEDDLGDYGLCHKNKFNKQVSFFDYLQEKSQCGSIIHYGLIQYLHILHPNHV